MQESRRVSVHMRVEESVLESRGVCAGESPNVAPDLNWRHGVTR